MREKMQKKHLLILSLTTILLSASSCVSIPDTKICSVAGTMSAGAICATTNSHVTSDMNLDQWLDFLEANPYTGKGPAVCMSSRDYARVKTAVQQTCRLLGRNKCKYEILYRRR